MFGRQITLFRLFGFRVGVDWSWLILAILIIWTLGAGLFPAFVPGLGRTAYWSMAVAGALGLFFSIIFHELSHSLVSRRYDMPIRGITLFIFGGVAEMEVEPPSPQAEFRMAIAGPIASLVLAGVFFLVSAIGEQLGGPISVIGVLSYLFWINAVLAIFNLVPAFPLDGGRMLRAALWSWKKNFRWATRIAAATGGFFGLALMVLGIVAFVSGNFVGGLWWFLLGLFVRFAANASYQQVVLRQSFSGVSIASLMKPDPVTVSPSLTVSRLIEDDFYRHYHKMFPVVEEGRLLGAIGLREVKEVDRAAWGTTRVGDVLSPLSDRTAIPPEMDAIAALAHMNRVGNGRLCVAKGDRLVGVVTRKDLLDFLSLRLALEGCDEGRSALRFFRGRDRKA